MTEVPLSDREKLIENISDDVAPKMTAAVLVEINHNLEKIAIILEEMLKAIAEKD